MTEKITFFETADDLIKITGITEDELWDNGFNLDDMDCGMTFSIKDFPMCDVKEQESDFSYKEVTWVNDTYSFPYFLYRILSDWENHCVGYYIVKYNENIYVTLHHA